MSRSLSARESLRESAQGRQGSSSSSNGGQGNKVSSFKTCCKSKNLKIRVLFQVFPKTAKLSPGPATLARQDTIDEGGEGDQSLLATVSREARQSLQIERPPLERQPTERDRLLDPASIQRERERIERNLSLERERQIEMASSRATTSDTYDTGLREQPITLAQRDLIATVLDMKVDVRLEMQRMSQRMGRVEDLLSELIKRISMDSSGQSTPADEAIQNITTTVCLTTSTTTATAAVAGTSSGGNGLGPILLRKRRSKSRKAPAPPKTTSPEQTRLLEADLPSTSTARKREFL